jgi:hypothetical protein
MKQSCQNLCSPLKRRRKSDRATKQESQLDSWLSARDVNISGSSNFPLFSAAGDDTQGSAQDLMIGDENNTRFRKPDLTVTRRKSRGSLPNVSVDFVGRQSFDPRDISLSPGCLPIDSDGSEDCYPEDRMPDAEERCEPESNGRTPEIPVLHPRSAAITVTSASNQMSSARSQASGVKLEYFVEPLTTPSEAVSSSSSDVADSTLNFQPRLVCRSRQRRSRSDDGYVDVQTDEGAQALISSRLPHQPPNFLPTKRDVGVQTDEATHLINLRRSVLALLQFCMPDFSPDNINLNNETVDELVLTIVSQQ